MSDRAVHWFLFLGLVAVALRTELFRRRTLVDQAQLTTLVGRLDQASNAIAARIKKIEEERKAGGLTAEQEAQHAADLDRIVTVLEGMGRDESNPIPEVPEDAPAEAEPAPVE